MFGRVARVGTAFSVLAISLAGFQAAGVAAAEGLDGRVSSASSTGSDTAPSGRPDTGDRGGRQRVSGALRPVRVAAPSSSTVAGDNRADLAVPLLTTAPTGDVVEAVGEGPDPLGRAGAAAARNPGALSFGVPGVTPVNASAVPAPSGPAASVAGHTDPGAADSGTAPHSAAAGPATRGARGGAPTALDVVVIADQMAAPIGAAPIAPRLGADRSAWVMRAPLTRPEALIAGAIAAIDHFFDSAAQWLSGLPSNPLVDFLSGALLLVRRTFFDFNRPVLGASNTITFPELDSTGSSLAVRVDPSQQAADAIRVDAGSTFTLTLPGPATGYTVLANKPDLVVIAEAGDQLHVTANKPGFLGLLVRSADGSAERYVGLYIADPDTHLVPDTVEGYLPVGSVTVTDSTGDAFVERFNFRDGVRPIDYLYIYDQGGADYTDGTLKKLLAQALRHGVVPVVVYYNIQNVLNSSGQPTGVVEGPDGAYQAINDYDQSGQSLFSGYMQRYFTKLKADFGTMDALGVPVQVVMEPDFLSYMGTATPSFPNQGFVPDPADRTLNTAQTSAIYAAGLLTAGTDPAFPDTVAGMVQAINYYTATKNTNVRIGWKTNIWGVADQQNWSLGLMHVTDSVTYPWQSQWSGPLPTWEQGRDFIAGQGAGLGAFLDKVGVTSWEGASGRAPFLAIDKYGVDGAYTFDPDMLTDSQTAAFGNLSAFVVGANLNLANLTDSDTQKYFGLSKAGFAAFYAKYQGAFPKAATDVQAVFTTLQDAAKDDPNMAMWFFNADQWNNYLFFVNSLSEALDGTKVMIWQIPQGHVNGSTTLPGTDLTDTVANFEDSATSYFFGDSFTAAGGRLAHFTQNHAADPAVTVSGNTVTWGEHMSLAQDSGVLSVLFGAGLGVSTRGSPTPGGDVNDHNFWFDKASGYLTSAAGV